MLSFNIVNYNPPHPPQLLVQYRVMSCDSLVLFVIPMAESMALKGHEEAVDVFLGSLCWLLHTNEGRTVPVLKNSGRKGVCQEG